MSQKNRKGKCDNCGKELIDFSISIPEYIKYFCSYECGDKFIEEKEKEKEKEKK